MEDEKQLYPRRRTRKDKSNRRWRVEYSLAYDGGGSEWEGYYRTKIGAKIAAFWNVNFASWGGRAILIERR